ncbi:MAG: riboflavin synthase [Bdellovibrionales bacterium]|nr:riboflavin synthase [Bdellovibrionales bacterium]
MFTGIVSCSAPILKARKRNSVIEIALPSKFSDVRSGDSVAVDGVCLTVEKIDSSEMVFALAQDTLRATGWNLKNLENKNVNLEPSLKVGSSLGGHFVTGHVDGVAEVQKIEINPSSSSPRRRGSSTPTETAYAVLKLPKEFKPFLFKKGYLTVNGVSLTIQEILGDSLVRLGLVPETLKRTNLSQLKEGDQVTFEVCYLTRTIVNQSLNKD